MSRAALLPTVGDPVLLGMWLRFYEKYWSQEVDTTYIYINGIGLDHQISDYHHEKLSGYSNIVVKTLPGNDHGYGLKELVQDCEEEYVLLIEDDGWIFEKGVVDENFKKIESGEYKFLGSPRTSIDMDIYKAQKEVQPELKYVDKNGIGDTGTNFWPNFVFTRNDILKQTDMHFWGKVWNKGDRIEQIDYTVQKDGSGADTFSWASIQIRDMLDEDDIGLIPQYKCYPHDPWLSANEWWTFSGDANWIHTGSISSGINRYLQIKGSPLRDLYKEDKQAVKIGSHELASKDDFAMRIAFWQLSLDYSKKYSEDLKGFREAYQKAIMNIKRLSRVPDLEVTRRYEIYKELLGLGI